MKEGVRLAGLSTTELKEALASGTSIALVPVGSVEPHGPHLPLGTDTIISDVAAERAADSLGELGYFVVIAPPVSYGVTEFSEGFAGRVSVSADVLTAFLASVAEGLLGEGFHHVCFVNNHLEPAHDAAVRAAAERFDSGRVSVACPLERRWGRTLSDEFKRGNCHAGQYETSLVLAAGRTLRADTSRLPAIETSLSDGIRAGKLTFRAMGLDAAYTGAPALASREEGEALYDKLAEMIRGTVTDALTGDEA